MKLWFQSCGDLGKDPIWKEYERSLNEHFQKVARPGTTIDLHGTGAFSGRTGRYQYDVYLHMNQIIEAAIRAEREGYDGFVQIGMQDYGFYEIREAVTIPVIFPVETALYVATMIAPKVGFLSYTRQLLARLNEKARAYGFGERVVPGAGLTLTPRDLAQGFTTPGPLIKMLDEAAKQVAEQGANVLITAGNVITMLLVREGVTELGGVRCLDSQGILVKMAEMMVDLQALGVNRNNMGRYAPQPRDFLAATRKVYGVE